MSPESRFSLTVWRDSVAMGDDCDAPHELVLTMGTDESLVDLTRRLKVSNYLARVMGRKATWILRAGRENAAPLAVLAQQWEEPRFLVDPVASARTYIDPGVKPNLYFVYCCQIDPNLVFECLSQGKPIPVRYEPRMEQCEPIAKEALPVTLPTMFPALTEYQRELCCGRLGYFFRPCVEYFGFLVLDRRYTLSFPNDGRDFYQVNFTYDIGTEYFAVRVFHEIPEYVFCEVHRFAGTDHQVRLRLPDACNRLNISVPEELKSDQVAEPKLSAVADRLQQLSGFVREHLDALRAIPIPKEAL